MKIAFITTLQMPWGGSELLWSQSAMRALEQGHQVCALVYREMASAPQIAELRTRGAQIFLRSSPSRTFPARVRRKLRPPMREVDQFSPDIICVSQCATYDVADDYYVSTWLLDRRTPYVLICECGHEIARGFVASKLPRIRSLFNRAHRIGFLGQHLHRQAERQLAMPISNGIVVSNPVNLSDTSIVAWPENPEASFVQVGRLDIAAKGSDILLQVLADSSWRDRSWNMVLYGNGEDQQPIQEMARFYGLSDRLRFGGYAGDIRELWSRHHVLVMPSRWEGVPLAMVEAMLCGRVVVVTDVGANRDWIDDGLNGFLADAPVPARFADAMERAWQSRADWAQIGARAHERAKQTRDADPPRSVLDLLVSATRSGAAGEPESRSTRPVSSHVS